MLQNPDRIINIFIVVIIAAVLLPVAFGLWYDADLGEDAPAFFDDVWELFPVLVILVIIMAAAKWIRN